MKPFEGGAAKASPRTFQNIAFRGDVGAGPTFMTGRLTNMEDRILFWQFDLEGPRQQRERDRETRSGARKGFIDFLEIQSDPQRRRVAAVLLFWQEAG